ncbi:hypothetical protein M3Y97_01146500 [Aphelenchoides bicaudatus]|nr:hypothetical protein M3Y97_01146500 [Aphelenchoides bicaudatus]
MKQQKVVKYLLQLTGFYWDSNQSQIYKYVGSIRSIIILIVCWYSTLFQFAILIINPDIWATYNNTYFLILSWNTQESIALVFLFYWFRSGRIKTLVDLTHECKSKKAPSCNKIIGSMHICRLYTRYVASG